LGVIAVFKKKKLNIFEEKKRDNYLKISSYNMNENYYFSTDNQSWIIND